MSATCLRSSLAPDATRAARVFVRWILSAVLLLAGTVTADPLDVPASAVGEGAGDGEQARVEARLLIDSSPDGPARVGVHFRLDRGWHIYWKNPGESGLATELEWTLPGEVGPIYWPAPEVFEESDGFITTYGYAGEVLLTQDVALDRVPAPGAPIGVVADFLVCEVQCVPGRIELSRGWPETPNADVRALFDTTRRRVPVSAERAGVTLDVFYSQSAVRPGDKFRAALAVQPHEIASGSASLAFIPEALPDVDLEVTGRRPHPFATRGEFLTLAGRVSADADGTPQRLRGVLKLRAPDEARFVEVDLELPMAPEGAAIEALDSSWLEPAAPAAAGLPFWQAVLFALLGGLILNLMPCVLPVLAIKVIGVAELGELDRAGRIRQGVAYTAGVLATMALLAAVVVGLRAAGTAVGWGFQFQEPLFVAAISAVLLVFALNLFGVFEVSLPLGSLGSLGQSGSATVRSFFEGLLAVIVATPCTAPFLGTAVGFAFASSPATITAIFLSIGLGLAFPFLAISFVPALARWVPRAGNWMVELRRGLGFALIGTIVWLLWVVGRSAGIDGMTGLLAWLVALAFLCWAFGAAQAAQRTAWMGLTALAALGVAVGATAIPFEPVSDTGPTRLGALEAAPYDPASIESALDDGRPVFVYFTADWCLTCKVNERAVLSSERVQDVFQARAYATFKADWTRRDETIRRELERFGRAGVPMYLVYSPDAPGQPELLPEVLTVDLLLNSLERAAPVQVRGETPRRNS